MFNFTDFGSQVNSTLLAELLELLDFLSMIVLKLQVLLLLRPGDCLEARQVLLCELDGTP